MSDIVNNKDCGSRDALQASSIKMQAYSTKIDLLSNATVIEKVVQFVERRNKNGELGRDFTP